MESACAKCPFNNTDRICRKEEGGKYPVYCATVNLQDILAKAREKYLDADVRLFAAQASRQEASCYMPALNAPGKTIPTKTRIQETAEFCQRMKYQRIGLAFCGGVHAEAAMLVNILEAYGLEVVSIMCKAGGTCKEFLGLADEDKIIPGRYETMCNPIGQAMILNDEKTEFNLVMGLCVGHDSLFLRYSKAMCTVVAVKDRLLGHNPMAALYTSYYAYLLEGDGSIKG